jgi:hypothetical protein
MDLKQLSPESEEQIAKLRQEELKYLTHLASQWRRLNREPENNLSGIYTRALYIAAGHQHLLSDPIPDFLELPGYMQSWVLGQLGRNDLAGYVIGQEREY